MKYIDIFRKKIKSVPIVIALILFVITILNSVVPGITNTKEKLNTYAYRLNYILENTEFDYGVLKKQVYNQELTNEKCVYYNANDEEITDKDYINIKENETVLSFKGNKQNIKYTGDYSKEKLANELKEICMAYYSMNIISNFFEVILKVSLLYLAMIVLTQYLTKRRIKAWLTFKYVSVSSVISSVICFIVWGTTKFNSTYTEFLSLILTSIIFSILISNEIKKCVTSDYKGEGMDSDDIY